MATASKNIVIFLIILTVAANIINFSGIGAALEIDPHTQGEEAVDRSIEEAESIEPSQGVADTLFSMFTSVSSTGVSFFNIIFAAPMMFNNLGIPTWLTAAFFSPMVIIVAGDVMHLLTGRNP